VFTAHKPVRREFVRFKDLTAKSKSDPAATIEEMASLLRNSKLRGSIQFHLLAGDEQHVHALSFGKGKPKTHKAAIPKPNLVVTLNLADWWQIAKGAVSPLEVFGRGQMHVRGDYSLGLRVLAHLAANEGRLTLCA